MPCVGVAEDDEDVELPEDEALELEDAALDDADVLLVEAALEASVEDALASEEVLDALSAESLPCTVTCTHAVSIIAIMAANARMIMDFLMVFTFHLAFSA